MNVVIVCLFNWAAARVTDSVQWLPSLVAVPTNNILLLLIIIIRFIKYFLSENEEL